MNPPPGRFRRKGLGDPIMLKNALGDPPLLDELLSKDTLQLASSLTGDDKEVLAYLIGYGCRVIGAPVSVCKSPWKRPWKSSSKASTKEQVFPGCYMSNSCAETSVASVYEGDALSKRTTWLLAKHKASCKCDCFSCYAGFWSRWSVSANRDLMNEILDVVEEGLKSSNSKKKKKADKKRAVPGAVACQGKQGVNDDNEHHVIVQMMPSAGLVEEGLADIPTSKETMKHLDCNDEVSLGPMTTIDCTAQSSVIIDEAPLTVTPLLSGRKMSMFRVTKQKEKAYGSIMKTSDSRVKKDSDGTSLGGDRESGVEAAELSEDVPTEASELLAMTMPPALSSVKNTPRLHRIGKRRQNQVIPLDCEGLLGVEGEQDSTSVVENAQAPISPRAADIGLGGRGFLACVFPDALGRVASRLWDLVSVRQRSRTVEYH